MSSSFFRRGVSRKCSIVCMFVTLAAIPAINFAGEIKNNIIDLASEAEGGDLSAAYELANLLFYCRNVPRTQAELEHKVSYAREVGDIKAIPGWEKLYAECGGVTNEDLKGINYWLDYAASRGHLSSQLAFFKYGQPRKADQSDAEYAQSMAEYHSKAFRYISAAMDAGSDEAIYLMGIAYGEGKGVNEDPLKSYKYFSAYSECTGVPVTDKVRALSAKYRLSSDELAASDSQIDPAILERCSE